MNNIIHVHIYDPSMPSLFKSMATDRSELHVYTCPSANECDAYKNGQCINVGNVFGGRCPVGQKRVSQGFTRRARKFHAQISEWKKLYSDHYNKLSSAPKRMTKVSGGWMLPYAHINMNESVPFKSKSSFLSGGCPFLEEINKGIFDSIIRFKPMALMGGEITSYQKKVVPKFIKDFSDNYPELFEVVSSGSDLAKSIIDIYDYKGRKAILKTIKPNVDVTISKKTWYWDGETISRTDKEFMIFNPVSWTNCFASFTPDDQAIITITNNDQVTEHTQFAD